MTISNINKLYNFIVVLLSFTAFAQQVVSGVITDENGNLIPGVNVIQKGTSNGVVSDFDGQYSISLTEGDQTLTISFIGYQTVELDAANSSSLNVVLQENVEQLDEVVMTGYGSQRSRDVTGAIASIRSESFSDALPVQPEQLLQGKVAGVSIVQSSGMPGANSTIRVRGSSSISAGNDPLYVIDGMPLQFQSAFSTVALSDGFTGSSPLSEEGINPLSLINPADIESIDVLKDASATAIYGSRGANGVIIITTKNKGKFSEFLTYDANVGFASIRKKLDFLNASEYKNYANSNNLPYSDEGANTDWQDQIFRTAVSTNHNISFAGGTQNSNVTTSIGLNEQEGIMLNSDLQKVTTRLNANHIALNGKLKLGLNLSYAEIDDNRAATNSNIGNEGGNMLKDGLRWIPTLPVYNSDGSYYQIGELRVNPVSWQEIEDIQESSLLVGNLSASIDLFEGLTLKTDFGRTVESVMRSTYVPSTHPTGEGKGGFGFIGKYTNENIISETTLNYEKQLTADSNISLMAGYSFQRFQSQNTYTQAQNFVSDATKWNLIQSGTITGNTSFKSANRLTSYFGRVNYKLQDKYLLTFTLRQDGSSRFGGNNKWGTFPSGAFAWNVIDEDFFNVDAFSNLKLRIGYGVTGNQEIPNNLYMETIGISGSAVYPFGGTAIPAVLPTAYANPDLKWEETIQTNIGIDFGLNDQKLWGSIDYYIKDTNDLLLQFSTAAPSVVSSQWANVGQVQNKGLEVNLNYEVMKKSNFTWDTNINFFNNVNEVISLSNENFNRDEIRYSKGSGVVSENNLLKIIKPGLSLETFYGRQFTGYDANGLETYLDADGDGAADLMAIGDANPDWTFGFNNSFSFGNFDASLNIRGVIGGDVYNNTAAEFSYVSQTPGVNVLKSALTTGASREQIAMYSSQWLEDGSYLRLDNLTIGYTLDEGSIPLVKKARFYFTANNLFVLTSYTGFDPEVRTRSLGVDYLMYPRPTSYVLGTKITF